MMGPREADGSMGVAEVAAAGAAAAMRRAGHAQKRETLPLASFPTTGEPPCYLVPSPLSIGPHPHLPPPPSPRPRCHPLVSLSLSMLLLPPALPTLPLHPVPSHTLPSPPPATAAATATVSPLRRLALFPTLCSPSRATVAPAARGSGGRPRTQWVALPLPLPLSLPLMAVRAPPRGSQPPCWHCRGHRLAVGPRRALSCFPPL